jgi:hypothetical protein
LGRGRYRFRGLDAHCPQSVLPTSIFHPHARLTPRSDVIEGGKSNGDKPGGVSQAKCLESMAALGAATHCRAGTPFVDQRLFRRSKRRWNEIFATPQSVIQVTPTNLNLGSIVVGKKVSQTASVTNTGNNPVSISAASVSRQPVFRFRPHYAPIPHSWIVHHVSRVVQSQFRRERHRHSNASDRQGSFFGASTTYRLRDGRATTNWREFYEVNPIDLRALPTGTNRC